MTTNYAAIYLRYKTNDIRNFAARQWVFMINPPFRNSASLKPEPLPWLGEVPVEGFKMSPIQPAFYRCVLIRQQKYQEEEKIIVFCLVVTVVLRVTCRAMGGIRTTTRTMRVMGHDHLVSGLSRHQVTKSFLGKRQPVVLSCHRSKILLTFERYLQPI
jgi:hypothetical protein